MVSILLTLRGFRFCNHTADSLREITGSLELVREPENQYDHNALAVYHVEEKIGYIAKEQAIMVTQILKKEKVQLMCTFYAIEETHAILEWEIPTYIFTQLEERLETSP